MSFSRLLRRRRVVSKTIGGVGSESGTPDSNHARGALLAARRQPLHSQRKVLGRKSLSKGRRAALRDVWEHGAWFYPVDHAGKRQKASSGFGTGPRPKSRH